MVGSSPWLFAASRVLLRLQAPRHPPLTLSNLENIDARARYGILKKQAHSPERRQPLEGEVEEGAAVGTHQALTGRADTASENTGQSQRDLQPCPQNGIVMPAANYSARLLPGRDTPEGVRPKEGGMRKTASSQ